MKQFFTVLKFELNNYFKNKSFLVTTILLTLLAIGVIVVPGIFMGGKDTEDKESGHQVKTLAILDRQAQIEDLDQLEEMMGQDIQWKECSDDGEVRNLVENQTADAGFIVEDLLHYTYVVENSSMRDNTEVALQQALAALYRGEQLKSRGINV